MSHLTQKERMLLEDQKSHEEACIKKYSEYARRASDPQLRQLFTAHSQQEQQHLNTINQLLQGKIPPQNQQNHSQQGGSNSGSGASHQDQQGRSRQQKQLQEQHGFFGMENNLYQDTQEARNSQGQNQFNQTDYHLCNDLLMTEKYVSGTYNTAIFEFRDSTIRQVLNHIQREEQKHGEDIFNYMLNQGMYQPQ